MDHVLDETLFTVSRAGAVSLNKAELQRVSDWLAAFEASDSKFVVSKTDNRLWADYESLEGTRAAAVLMAKLEKKLVRFEKPTALSAVWDDAHPHRRRCAEVALAKPKEIAVANATCSDWDGPRIVAITVVQVLGAWFTALLKSLQKNPTLPFFGKYFVPPKMLSGALATARVSKVGPDGRKAWEDALHRYEWDYQHGRVEVYALSTGTWLHEADPNGTITKTKTAGTRRWDRP